MRKQDDIQSISWHIPQKYILIKNVKLFEITAEMRKNDCLL